MFKLKEFLSQLKKKLQAGQTQSEPTTTRVLRDRLENVVHTVTTRRGFRRAEEDAAEGHQPDVSPVQSASTAVFRGYLISDQGNRIEIIGGSTAEQVSDRLRRICSNPASIDIFVREGETFENLKEALRASTCPAFQTSGNEVVLGEIPETNDSAKGGTQTRSVSTVLKPQPHLGKEPTVETQGVLRPKEKGSQWQAPLDAGYGASPKQPENALQEQVLAAARKSAKTNGQGVGQGIERTEECAALASI